MPAEITPRIAPPSMASATLAPSRWGGRLPVATRRFRMSRTSADGDTPRPALFEGQPHCAVRLGEKLADGVPFRIDLRQIAHLAGFGAIAGRGEEVAGRQAV